MRAAASISGLLFALVFGAGLRAQSFALRFELDGINCGDEVFGAPGEVLRINGFAVVDAAAAGARSWSLGFSAGGGDFRFIAAEVEGCNAACAGALIGQPVNVNAPFAVDPAKSPTDGPLSGSPQGLGFVDAVLLEPPDGQLASGASRLLRFVFEVTVPDTDAGDQVRLAFIDGLQGPGLPVLNGFSLGTSTIHAGNGLSLGECVFKVNRKAFRRGDVVMDGRLLIGDATTLLQRIFVDSEIPLPCPDAGDANDDGDINITDPMVMLHHLFTGNFRISPPGPDSCGRDPTDDRLPECFYDTTFCRQ